MCEAIGEHAKDFVQQNPWWLCKSCLNPDIWHDRHANRLGIRHKQDGCRAHILDTIYILYVFLRCPWRAKQDLLMRLQYPHADETEETYADDYVKWLFLSWSDGPRPNTRNPNRPIVLLHMHVVILLFHSIRDPTSFGPHTGQAIEACQVTALSGNIVANNYYKKTRVLQRKIHLSSSILVSGPDPINLLGPRTVVISGSGAPTGWERIYDSHTSDTTLYRRKLTLPVIHLPSRGVSTPSKSENVPRHDA
jgi:hypothetical protein